MPKEKSRTRKSTDAGHHHAHETEGKGKHDWVQPKKKQQRKD